MQIQMTLDGNPITDENFEIRRFAAKYPERFAKYCEGEGIVYRGKSSELNTLLCIGDLEKYFGLPVTVEMIDALAKYTTLKNPPKEKFKIFHHDDIIELLNPKGEEYRRLGETSLEEDTKRF